MGVLRVTMRRSEMGRRPCPMKPRMTAGWGNAEEILGLPCGRGGVTPWKFRGYRVENSALPQALAVAKLFAYVLHCSIVIDEFPAGRNKEKIDPCIRVSSWPLVLLLIELKANARQANSQAMAERVGFETAL